jgi:transcriptional regulator with XRE-family HTH domain
MFLPWRIPKPPRELDVGAIRMAVNPSYPLGQASFAGLLGVSRRTLEGWESGRRKPTGPARALLAIIASDPEAYKRVAQAAFSEAAEGRLKNNQTIKTNSRT